MIDFDFKTGPEIDALDYRAQQRTITIPEYCRELTNLGIDGIEQMLYIHRAFGLPLGEAKKICIELEYGSVDAWADEMCEAIDEIGSDLRNMNRTKED